MKEIWVHQTQACATYRFQLLIVSLNFFQVSKYTGRIHLYSCIHGVETRPTPLFKNFRPEELETNDPPVHNNLAHKLINDDLIYRPALLSFIDEWNSLRPIEQSKLYNKPLQLPLAVELCLNESQNHNKEVCLKVIVLSCGVEKRVVWEMGQMSKTGSFYMWVKT